MAHGHASTSKMSMSSTWGEAQSNSSTLSGIPAINAHTSGLFLTFLQIGLQVFVVQADKHRHCQQTVHSIPLCSLSFPLLSFPTHHLLRNHETSLLQSKWLLDKQISLFNNSTLMGKYSQVSQCFSVLFCYTFTIPLSDPWPQHRHGYHDNLQHMLCLWGSCVISLSSSVYRLGNMIYPMSPDDLSPSVSLVGVTFVRYRRSLIWCGTLLTDCGLMTSVTCPSWN